MEDNLAGATGAGALVVCAIRLKPIMANTAEQTSNFMVWFSWRWFATKLRPPLFDCSQNVGDNFRLRFRTLRAAGVQAHGNHARVHVAPADDEHRVDFRFLGLGDSGLSCRVATTKHHPN